MVSNLFSIENNQLLIHFTIFNINENVEIFLNSNKFIFRNPCAIKINNYPSIDVK